MPAFCSVCGEQLYELWKEVNDAAFYSTHHRCFYLWPCCLTPFLFLQVHVGASWMIARTAPTLTLQPSQPPRNFWLGKTALTTA